MDYLKLSKEISYALRHAPWEYELELDEEGWVNISQLLISLRESPEWKDLNEQDLYVITEKTDKKRHEILNGKIRALYGHSVSNKIIKESSMPPTILYHGTAKRFIPSIREKGILPQRRQYVHLSVDAETAIQVGRRRDDIPVLLEIYSLEAFNAGVQFYLGNDKVWLADYIPSQYIELVK